MFNEQEAWSDFNLGSTALYEIKVHGYLDSSWSNRLGGIAIHHATIADTIPITILHGKLVDQAALLGVLNSLYGLGFAILSLECVPEPRPGRGLHAATVGEEGGL